jgi:beta-glucanase (GH16 family)
MKIQFLNLLIVVLFILFVACNKEEGSNFTAGFSYEYIDDNTVLYTNTSTGEYYSLTWNFGNGDEVTTTDKSQTYQISYPVKGDYVVSLKVLDYGGTTKSQSSSINIANSNLPDLEPAFNAEPTLNNPNYVLLTNTTEGEYDSFKWLYLDQVITNQNGHLAFFPSAGNYNVELQIIRGEDIFSDTQSVTINQDYEGDPNLFWAEEFNYTGLPNPTFWNMETGGSGWGNNELQYYTATESNAKVDNGVLTITAREEAFGGRDYTSARITTQNKFDFKYGRIEARIRLPYGQGLWPAFWMLGANFSDVGWPYCGEIDIMEMLGGQGKDNTCHATLHWWNDTQNSKADYGESYSLPNGIFADDFHVFSIEWDELEIKAYMDGIQYYTINISGEDFSEFQENFFIILNVAVGGNWPGSPDATTEFPQTMEVDYIRVYID